MKKKIMIILYIFLTLFFIKILFNMFLNVILLQVYDAPTFAKMVANPLKTMNFIEPYIANYNYGNVLYNNGYYDDAIEEYKNALKGYVPQHKECSIRINYALAICKTVELDETKQLSIINAIATYETAIDVLTENGCANKDDKNGHSEEAETLKKDIQDEIERLKKLLQNIFNSNYNQEKENETQNNAETIEEKIQSIKEDAIKKQRTIEKEYTNWNKQLSPDQHKKKIW